MGIEFMTSFIIHKMELFPCTGLFVVGAEVAEDGLLVHEVLDGEDVEREIERGAWGRVV